MRTNYTSIRDIKDILNIYHEDNWKMKYWNYTDYNYLYLRYGNCIYDKYKDRYIANFIASRQPVKYADMSDVYNWRDFLRHLKTIHGDELFNNIEIVVWNEHNNKPMKIYFTGSSRTLHEIHYNIDYIDPEYHAWKRKIRFRWMIIKYKFNKFNKFFKNIFK